VDKGLRIRPVLLGEFAYCPKCGEWTYLGGPGEGPLCGHEVDRVSGSLLRGVLLEGLRPPSVVMRPEVYDVVVKWWRVYGRPFVSVSTSGLRRKLWRCYETHRFVSRRGAPR